MPYITHAQNAHKDQIMTDGLRLDRSRIHAHHVGGRDGSFQYPVVKIFNDDPVHVPSIG